MKIDEVSWEALRRITRALDVYSRALLRQHRLTGPQLAILREVGRLERAPIGTLAKASFLGPPTVTGIVDRLECQGLVCRMRSDGDRRQVWIEITAAGKELLKRKPPLLSSDFRDKLLQLPDAEQQNVCEVLQQVASMMEQAVGVR